MASALSIVLYQTISGPMSSMVRVTNKTVARAQLQSVSNIVIMDALNQAASGDCDADGSVEPRAWRTPPSAPAAPGGGGLIPLSIGAPVVDPWGTDYGYCVWDVGAVTTKCGGAAPNMLIGTTSPTAGNAVTQTVMAIISAGPNRQFQTSCRDYFNTTQDTIFPTGTPASSGAGGDDVVQRFTYTEAASATSSIWSLKVGDPMTAEIDRDLSIGPTAAPVVTVGSTTGIINAIAVQTSGQVTATGGMRVGDENDVTTCSNPGLLRWNTTLSDLEVCNGASGTWIVPGSGAGLPISGLSAATQNKALANAAFEQAWAWSGLAANAAGLSLSSSAPAGAGEKTLSVTNPSANGWAFYNVGRTFFSGNVGIGTATPAATLDIFGKHNVTSDCAGATLPCEDTDVQVFNSSGTWNKPAGGIVTYVQCWGGGGGGGGGGGAGSGRRGTTETSTNPDRPYSGKGGSGGSGGTGGSSGDYFEKAFLTSALLATETVTIGAGGASGGGGAGGAGGSGTGTAGVNGNAGGVGGNSVFGASLLTSTGGAGGTGGTKGGGATGYNVGSPGATLAGTGGSSGSIGQAGMGSGGGSAGAGSSSGGGGGAAGAGNGAAGGSGSAGGAATTTASGGGGGGGGKGGGGGGANSTNSDDHDGNGGTGGTGGAGGAGAGGRCVITTTKTLNNALTASTNGTGTAAGVYGANTGTNNTGSGVYGFNRSLTGYGVYSDGNMKVLGDTFITGKLGIGAVSLSNQLEVQGNVLIKGTLTATGGIVTGGAQELDSLGDVIVDYGLSNMFLGDSSGATATGGGNTALGAGSLATLTTGDGNTVIGSNAGAGILTGSNNIALGADVDVPDPDADNQLNIGNTIFGNLGTGSVGLGTTAPLALLQLGETTYAADARLRFATGNGVNLRSWSIGTQYGDTVTTAPNYGFIIRDETAGADRLVIDWATGHVGIGTAAPAANTHLHILTGTGVEGTPTFNAGTTLATQLNTAAGNWNRMSVISSITGSSVLELGDKDNPNDGYIRYDNNTQKLHFSTASTSTTNDKVTIDSTGNVGIGTTSPGATFHIYNATGDVLSYVETGAATNAATLQLIAPTTVPSAGSAKGEFAFGGSGYGSWGGANSLNITNANMVAASTSANVGPITFNHFYGAAPHERMRIDSVGNVGIGTTAPLKFLHVGAGADTPIMGAQGITVQNAGATGIAVRDATGDVENILYASGADGAVVGAASNHSLSLRTNNQNRLVIDTSGNATINGNLTVTGAVSGGSNNIDALSDAIASVPLATVFLGSQTGIANSTGTYNTGIGYRALTANTTGSNNTGLSDGALQNNTIGTGNVAIGGNTLSYTVARQESTAVGFSAMVYANSAGTAGITYNTALGAYALRGAVGGQATNTATRNTAVGHSAMISSTTGGSNTAVGTVALNANTTGSSNTAVGDSALASNVSGVANTAVGLSALVNNTSHNNTAVGRSALMYNTSGQRNTGIGVNVFNTGSTNTTGSDNTAIGYGVGVVISSGSNNTLIGSGVASTTLTTGSSNILIGTSSAVTTPAAATSNFLNIGNAIFATGMTGTVAAPAGNVGIGTTTPDGALDVMQTISGITTGLRFTGHHNPGVSAGGIIDSYDDGGLVRQLTLQNNGGNVGIGTKTPGYKLDVNGDIHSSTGLSVHGANLNGAVTIPTSGYISGNQQVGNAEMDFFAPAYDLGGTTTQGFAFFNTTGAAAPYSVSGPLMVIKRNGNVGIGTTAPGAMLSVGGPGFGNVAVYGISSNATGYGGYFQNTGANNSRGVYGQGTNWGVHGVGNDYGILGIANNAANGAGVYGSNSNAAGAAIYGYIPGGLAPSSGSLGGVAVYGAQTAPNNTGAGGYFMNSSATGYGVFSSATKNYFSGNVGIGTTTPNGKLDISGNGVNDGTVIYQDSDNTETIQTYIDGQWAARTTYAGACCNGLKIQPDVGYVTIGGPVTFNGNATGSGLTINSGVQIQGLNGRNYFRDTEGVGNLRVGAAWGVPGIYSESGPVQVGAAGGYILLHDSVAINSNGAAPGYPLQVWGNVGASDFWSGTCSCWLSWFSDERLKTNIKGLPQELGLSAILKLRPVTYHWKDKKRDKAEGELIGFVAQEVEMVIPNVVRAGAEAVTINTGKGEEKIEHPKNLFAASLTAPLVKAVQELAAQFNELADKLANVVKRQLAMLIEIADLKGRVAALEADNKKLHRDLDKILAAHPR